MPLTPMSESTIACLLVTHLPVKSERQRYPALRGKPLVIIERSCSGDMVLDSSPEAGSVTVGMPATEALARCPQATLMSADREFYNEVFNRFAERMAMRCPAVEKADLGCVYTGLEGLALIRGGEARMIASLLQVAPPEFDPHIGVASSRFAAYVAASTTQPGRAAKVPPDEAAFLSGRSIDLLPLSSGGKARLHLLGLHTLGRLAAMPAGAVQARLGSEGRRAWELARGIDQSPIQELSRAAA